MGKTFAEKVLALKTDKSSVTAGNIIEAFPDAVMCSSATFANGRWS